MREINTKLSTLSLQFTDNVTMIDHTTCENLLHYFDQFNNSSGGSKPRLQLQGFAEMRQTTPDATSIRVSGGKAGEALSTAG